ncbi:helix-turn-helix domain-containing protein [Paenibacillus psychroresistens]|uniref:helix-turn-helix domain-containing protein n=1 Tax=Paenibacillus psychroresistens TaxID=1778678 RepID=UPI001391A9F8|nr:helix-turn-helix domain-containing protein [Paenibacillus psychroresistens]
MKQTEKEAPLLHELFFSICQVETIDSSGNSIDLSPLEGHHAIVAFTKGTCNLKIAGGTLHFQSGTCFIVKPGVQVKFEDTIAEDFAGYWITFDIYRLGVSEPYSDMQKYFPYGQQLNPTPFIKFVDMLEQLQVRQQNVGKLECFKQQIRLQELIVFLLENHQVTEGPSDSLRAVKRSVTYLEENYMENITVEQLSQQAGIRRWEYSTLFQNLTGFKPLEYLTDVRMKRAKELLLLSNEPLRDIAHRVGFKDEYYFNRRFRQSMGISPKLYARTHQSEGSIKDYLGSHIELPLRQSRIVVIGYELGNLLTLGVRPVGADLTVIGKQVVYRNELHNISDIGPKEDLERIKALEPDFIFNCSTMHSATALVAHIAPTLVINREDSNFEKLRLIATVVGERPKAEKWIKDYKTKVKALWSQYSLDIGAKETVTVIVIVDGEFFVMGNHGLSYTLYHPLAFKPAEKVREMIEQGVDFEEISVEMLADYVGDRLFLLVGEEPRSVNAANDLIKSPLWKELPAVQRNLVYLVDPKWNYDDSITLERLLTVLPGILRNSS